MGVALPLLALGGTPSRQSVTLALLLGFDVGLADRDLPVATPPRLAGEGLDRVAGLRALLNPIIEAVQIEHQTGR